MVTALTVQSAFLLKQMRRDPAWVRVAELRKLQHQKRECEERLQVLQQLFEG